MITKLPHELKIIIFKNLNYKGAINLSLVNKDFNKIFKKLLDEEKICKFKIKDDINLLYNNIYQNHRFIKVQNIYYKIINVTQIGIILNLILKNGDIIYIDNKSINVNRSRESIECIDFILKSPFNIRLIELKSIKNKILQFSKQ